MLLNSELSGTQTNQFSYSPTRSEGAFQRTGTDEPSARLPGDCWAQWLLFFWQVFPENGFVLPLLDACAQVKPYLGRLALQALLAVLGFVIHPGLNRRQLHGQEWEVLTPFRESSPPLLSGAPKLHVNSHFLYEDTPQDEDGQYYLTYLVECIS